MTGLLQVTVELERGVEPIRGRISSRPDSWVSFTGWLELLGALERARSSDSAHGELQKDFGGIHDAGAAPRPDNRHRNDVGGQSISEETQWRTRE